MLPLALLVIMVMALGGCATPQPPTALAEATPYEAEAARRYGPSASVDYEPNAAGTHILVAYRLAPTPRQPLPRVSFFVYDVAAQRVLFEETAVPATVGWDDARYIRVERIPGTMPRSGGTILSYRLDVQTGRRLPDSG